LTPPKSNFSKTGGSERFIIWTKGQGTDDVALSGTLQGWIG
jgi:hypothetical protein